MTSEALTPREETILRFVVRRFIATGEPVSSRCISVNAGLDVSSATVRNVMASLSRRGFLQQPHTSAGRIPTLLAVRSYVRALPARKAETTNHFDDFEEMLQGQVGFEEVIQAATSALSDASSWAGMASPPGEEHLKISHLEVLSISQKEALVVLVMPGGQVHHQMVMLREPMSDRDREVVRNYLRDELTGLTLRAAFHHLKREMHREETTYNHLMRTALEMGTQAILARREEQKVLLKGELRFLEQGIFSTPSSMRAVLGILREKRLILDLLEQLQGGGTHVFVGLLSLSRSGEFRVPGVDDCSLVVSPYLYRGNPMGWLGVVGPVRMPYPEMMALVEQAAQSVSSHLEGQLVA